MLAGPPGLLEHGPGFSLEDLLPSSAQSTVCWCIMFFIISHHFFCVALSLTHSHLPRCWTAYNRAWWLKEMSVHSLITPRSNNVLAVLIQSYRASWNWYTCRITWHCSAFCMFHVDVGEHAVYSGVLNLFLFSLISWLHSQWILSLSLSLSPVSSLFFYPLSSLPLFLFCLGGMATAGQTSRQGYAWGSPMQLAESEVQ